MRDITIEEYLLGKTGYDIGSDALNSIFLDRGIQSGSTPAKDVDIRTRELATADLYMRCASTPGSSTTVREKDGDWMSERVGQKSDAWGKGKLIDMANAIYSKYGDDGFGDDSATIVSFGYN